MWKLKWIYLTLWGNSEGGGKWKLAWSGATRPTIFRLKQSLLCVNNTSIMAPFNNREAESRWEKGWKEMLRMKNNADSEDKKGGRGYIDRLQHFNYTVQIVWSPLIICLIYSIGGLFRPQPHPKESFNLSSIHQSITCQRFNRSPGCSVPDVLPLSHFLKLSTEPPQLGQLYESIPEPIRCWWWFQQVHHM